MNAIVAIRMTSLLLPLVLAVVAFGSTTRSDAVPLQDTRAFGHLSSIR